MFKNPLLAQRNFVKSLKGGKKEKEDEGEIKKESVIHDTRPSDEKKGDSKQGVIKKKRKRKTSDYVVFELDDK